MVFLVPTLYLKLIIELTLISCKEMKQTIALVKHLPIPKS